MPDEERDDDPKTKHIPGFPQHTLQEYEDALNLATERFKQKMEQFVREKGRVKSD